MFLETCLFRPFAHFLDWVVFFLVSGLSVLSILNMNSLTDTSLAVFFPVYGLSLYGSSAVQKLCSLAFFYLCSFTFADGGPGAIFKEHLYPDYCHGAFLYSNCSHENLRVNAWDYFWALHSVSTGPCGFFFMTVPSCFTITL